MTPQEAAQAGWNQFELLIRNMSQEDYAEACEELACTCEGSAEGVREDIRNPEEEA